MEMKILIITTPYDLHGEAVIWGLKQLGLRPAVWYSSEFPNKSKCSLSVSIDSDHAAHINIGSLEIFDSFDVVWNRRKDQPVPMPSSHPADHKIILTESNAFIKNVFSQMEKSGGYWINPIQAAQQANNKIIQLITAKSLGFIIPDTLFSNDHGDVLKFLQKHNGEIAFKSFAAGGWIQENGAARVLKTSSINLSHLENPNVIRSCPGIYQSLIKKEYEVRVTVMGNNVAAGLINSQSEGETVDWRYDYRFGNPSLKSICLPAKIAEQCIQLCQKLGLVFACIDIIVSKSGEYIFIELNESGQFLWKEAADPNLKMLDMFCQYLTAGDSFQYRTFNGLELSRFESSEEYRNFMGRIASMKSEDDLFTKE